MPLSFLLPLLFSLLFDGGGASGSSTGASLSDWSAARATYYLASDPRDNVGGACGYGDLVRGGYGMATVGLSESLFEHGQICGACFELRCVDDLRWCIQGTSIILAVTNFCPPKGHCNPPNKHFVLPIEAFDFREDRHLEGRQHACSVPEATCGRYVGCEEGNFGLIKKNEDRSVIWPLGFSAHHQFPNNHVGFVKLWAPRIWSEKKSKSVGPTDLFQHFWTKQTKDCT
ncbi:unnamed protein product [Linum tenue]|uniref:Expansin n=1 Tax=Linum tenue TaxID=586396 RepID=A0AAV0K800_9ROSI|nr:unnamed protein product [Linum tenue]